MKKVNKGIVMAEDNYTEQKLNELFNEEFCRTDMTAPYMIFDYVISKGSVICRYGNELGRFTIPIGCVYEVIGLPHEQSTMEYHEYKVLENLPVKCRIVNSRRGGVIQYMHNQSVQKECEQGLLVEDESWRLNLPK